MTQTATARPLPRTGARRAPATPPRRLRVVAPPQRDGGGFFLTLCVVLLLSGFVGVLMLNTAMAKGSYTMRDLQRRSDELADTQDDLRHALDAVSGPGPLARQAVALGMVPAQSPAFLRLSDGRVLGVAEKATTSAGFSVVTETQVVTGKGAATGATKATTTKAPATKTSTTKTPATTKTKGAKAPTPTPTPKPTGH